MIDPNIPIGCLTVGQFLELQRFETNKPKVTPKQLPKYLKPSCLADLIGCKIQTVYQNHHNGKLPGARKIGGRLLFETEAILQWIEDNSIPTKAESTSNFRKKLNI